MAKPYSKKDPHKKREAEKYDYPVPSRELVCDYLEHIGRPVSLKNIFQAFILDDPRQQEGMRRRLKAMIRDGQLIQNRRGSFALVTQLELIAGRVQGTREGVGFLIPDDGSDDIFLSIREMQAIFPGDRVLVRTTGYNFRGRREGAIAEVLEHNTQQVVGRLVHEDGVTFIDSHNTRINHDVIIPPEAQHNALPGQYVVANISKQPAKRRGPTGEICQVLGNELTPGMETELAIRAHNLPFKWPELVMQHALQLPDKVQENDLKGRQDLRDHYFVTIDGEDAKDFDDAVHCKPINSSSSQDSCKWRLFVAIADVSHYVKPDTALDQEAYCRGTSVYFPNRVIPMLPERLSNGLCSLKPGCDRLAMVCQVDITDKGQLKNYQFYPAVIHSKARLTYTKVAAAMSDKTQRETAWWPAVSQLTKVFHLLIKARKQRGAIDFDTVETRVVFGEKGKIDRIVPSERNDAHRLIEEMMLAANVCAAKTLENAKIPALYRVHQCPEKDRLTALRDFLKPFSLRLGGGSQPTAKEYGNLIKRIKGRPDAHLLQTVLLRSLTQAIYSPNNVGHFGLAYQAYAQFTSPIRRYPDLIVHRALYYLLSKQTQPNPSAKESKNTQTKQSRANQSEGSENADIATSHHHLLSGIDLERAGQHCSSTERRADLATRDALDWLKCEYMQDKVGQSFAGIISSVTGFGLFVELNDIYVEGLVHITALHNDYYQYDSTHHLLRGRRSNKVYRLGDSIQVVVARVDLDQRSIDFELAEA